MLHGAEGRCVMVQDFPNANGHEKMYFFFSAWPKRAEQWSRSADGATEGKNQPICHPGSVTRARSSLPDPRIQWRSTVNGSGGEFPACYNKNGAFYIGDKSHEIRAGYTQNTSLSMSKSHFSGSAGDNQFTGQQLFFFIIFVLQHSHALVMVIRNHCWNNCLIQLSLEGGDIFLLFLFLIGKDLNMHFSILENIIESHPAMTSDVSDLLQYLQEEAYLSSPGFMQHSRSISSILPFIYRTQVCRPATRLYLSRGPEERCHQRGN